MHKHCAQQRCPKGHEIKLSLRLAKAKVTADFPCFFENKTNKQTANTFTDSVTNTSFIFL